MDFFPPGDDVLPYRLVEASDVLYEPAPGAHAAIPEVEAIAARMRWHFEHPDESRALGEQGRGRVAHLTWAAAAKRLLEVIGNPGNH